MAMAVTGAAVAYVGAVLRVFVVVAGGKPIVRERWCCWVHTAVLLLMRRDVCCRRQDAQATCEQHAMPGTTG